MSSNYSPVVDDVISVIRHLGQQSAALELTKSFRGIIFKQDVSILEVSPDDATFRASNIEMCAATETEVYLHNQLFPKPVMAQLKSLNIRNGMLVLSDFAYADMEWKKRQHERVQPKCPIYVTLHWKGKALRACMENISVDGLGLLAYKLFEKGMKIRPGSIIRLDFQLSPGQKFSALRGRIIYINTIDRYSPTMGIRLFPKVKEVRVLEKYVARRKQEILEELNQEYSELSKPRGVDSLYF